MGGRQPQVWTPTDVPCDYTHRLRKRATRSVRGKLLTPYGQRCSPPHIATGRGETGSTKTASTVVSSSSNTEAQVVVAVPRVVPVAVRAAQVPRIIGPAATAIHTLLVFWSRPMGSKQTFAKTHRIRFSQPCNQATEPLLKSPFAEAALSEFRRVFDVSASGRSPCTGA